MVVAGQYLERPALIAVGPDGEGPVLEGLYHRGRRRPSLLVLPDADAGGMDAPVVAELAWACARAGHPSLRFQHRGRGASQGTIDPARGVEDALAALRHLAASAPGPLALAGVGSGCATAIGVARAFGGIRRLVLVAPPTTPEPGGLAAELLAILPAEGGPPPDGVAAALGAAGRVEVVAGADARFLTGLPAVGKLALEWIAGR